MRKFGRKLASSAMQKLSGSSEADTSGTTFPDLHTNLERSIYRYRKQRGVNLGSWFVHERWINDAPFASAAPPAQSDLDIARGENAKSILEAHWDSWVTESDMVWLAERGINTVRIPIGYYHLCGVDQSVLAGTDFESHHDVFAGAWARVIHAIEIAGQAGLGVLVDLHAAPGKQNGDAHAGTSNPPAFFKNHRHRQHTIHVLRTLVTHLNAHDPPLTNIVGVELLNEPQPSGADGDLKNWYSSAMKAIGALNPTLPLYLSDCWKTEHYAEYIKSTGHPSLLVLDHHLYRCFTSSDISTPAHEHARSLTDENAETPRMFARVAELLDAAGAGLVIGEWSAALNPGSLTGSPDDAKNYVSAQLQLFEKHCSGYFFWTYKKPGWDQGWCFRDAVQSGAFPARVGLFALRSFEADQERQMQALDAGRTKAYNDHTGYWSQFPGNYKHERFADGFSIGWGDAYAFLTSSSRLDRPVSELAFLGAWARSKTKDMSNFWEFEHGFKQGVRAARSDFQENYC
ncbi:glucan 1,3-beta-glucosidase 3 [Favolaschia claudopus]|uniref:Glucan 1,3-beta-glucosidase 3 n=1 Tax=Favolaschia claudopus TaxID=2862362 RepID=A0AAW0BXD9_9AGAR